MFKNAEGAFRHPVLKKRVRPQLRDFAGKSLDSAKVFSLPGNFLIEFKQAGSSTSDNAFSGICGGFDVSVDIAGEIEAYRDRSVDRG
ncbi:MAG TPA: hypothetical protein VFC46_01525 [Humisphaera sp.]|nr:hypothetical protein [Humisphaera sp.]